MGLDGKTGSGMRGTIGAALGQAQSAADSKEYLVEGAKLFCVNGSCVTALKIPEKHNYASGGKSKANCKDCKAGEHILYFGECKKNEESHQCEGFMDLAEQWESTGASASKAENVSGEDAISMSCVLLCKKGGIIIPVTSGQGYDGAINWGVFIKRYQNVVRWAAGKNLTCQVFGHDPINLNTGNYIYEKEDLVIGGAAPVSFKLFYNTMDCGSQGVLGEGWSHNYGVCLKKVAGDDLLVIILSDGREVAYCRKLGNEYEAVMGDLGGLKRSVGGFTYESEGRIYEFDAEGALKKRSDGNGNYLTFTYDADCLLTRVETGTGSCLRYTYNEEKKLISVSDHSGRKVSLEYQYGKLGWFTDCNGNVYTYEYNDNGKLAGVVTPGGIWGVKNEYDGANRVLKQTMPDGGVTEFRYDDKNNRTYVKEQNGNLVIYECDERMRNVRTVYEDGEELYSYNDKNQKTLYHDKNGNITKFNYDSRGNLIQVTNALKQTLNMIYDTDNRLINVKWPNGGQEKMYYDKLGNLVEYADVSGCLTKAFYDNHNRLTHSIQPDGFSNKFDYDDKGNLSRFTDAGGHVISLDYDILNRVIKKVDGNGNISKYKYNRCNDIIEICNANGDKKILEYNESRKIKAITDFNGSIQNFEYDQCGRLWRYVNQDGDETILEYDIMGNLSKKNLPNGGEINWQYNHLGKLIKITNPEGEITAYDYDANGNCIKVTDSTGREYNMSYNALNKMIGYEEADGYGFAYEYNTLNQMISITDKEKNKISRDYDVSGRLIKDINIDGDTVVYEYNSMGLPAVITNSSGIKGIYSYLPGRLLEKIDYNDGTGFSFSYDNNGNLIEKSSRNGYHMQYHYDALNRVDKVGYVGKQIAQFQYDPAGNIISVKNPFGNSKTFTYSATNRLTRIDDGYGNLTNYHYDGSGEIQFISQSGYRANGLDGEIFCQNQNQTEFKRNKNGQILSITDALGNIENYRYDELGRLLQKTDRDGYETSYEYALSGKIKKIVSGNHEAEYTYDRQRNLVAYQDWNGCVTMERYQNGRIKSVTDQMKNRVSYEYGVCGKRKAVIYPDGSRVDYRYNKNLQLTQVSMSGGAVNYEYNSHGRLSKKSLPNGVTSTYKYNDAGFLSYFAHEENDRVLDEYQNFYDDFGRKIRTQKWNSGLAKESGGYEYQYDASGRLTSVKKDGIMIREYTYDSFDNRASLREIDGEVFYRYNTANQLTGEVSKTAKEYSYDKRGNLISVREDGINTYSYAFNAENRMERAENIDGEFAVYGYNGAGMRIRKETGCMTDKGPKINSREDYILDYTKRSRNRLETDEKGVRQKYIWDGGLLGFAEGGRYRYNLTDDLGSTIRIMSSNGNTLNLYHYDAFGVEIGGKGNEDNKFQYTGYTKDKISGTYFAEAREYIPAIGRFISEDIEKGKILNPNTLNHYNYCWCNPVTLVDLDGRTPTFSQENANGAIWNYYAEKVEDAWDGAAESAGEAWDSAVDSCKGGWNDFMDFQIGYTKTRIDLVEKLTGAKTVNVSGAGRVTAGGSVSGAAGLTFDSAGNIAIQLTLNGGGGLPGVGYGLSVTGSNAPLFEDYAGMAGVVGGSFAPGINIGYDQIIMENGYLGSSFSVGPGINLPFTAFFEMHGEAGYTWTPFDFNIYEFYNGLKFKDINNCPY